MTLPRVAFERGVRRLDGPEARGFVVDLLEARGYRTAVDGRVVTATRETGGSGEGSDSMRLRVVDSPLAGGVGGDHVGLDGLLVTGGAVARVGATLVARAAAGGSEDRLAVMGPEVLYEWFAYAIDGDARAALEERYLGATDPSVFERAWVGFVAAATDLSAWLERIPIPTGRTAGVVLLALFALVAVTTAGPLATFGPAPSTKSPADDGASGVASEVTSVPVTVTPDPTATAAGPPLPDVCPPAPVDAHPSSLRPAVRQTATASGLDGWELSVTQNLTEYDYDPNDQQAGLVPEVRHIAVFERPGRGQFRLGLDRWDSPRRAAESVARGGPWRLGVLWGAYTAWVEWEATGSGGATAARQLLAAVTTPDGTQLGDACVSEIDSGPAATATP